MSTYCSYICYLKISSFSNIYLNSALSFAVYDSFDMPNLCYFQFIANFGFEWVISDAFSSC